VKKSGMKKMGIQTGFAALLAVFSMVMGSAGIAASSMVTSPEGNAASFFPGGNMLVSPPADQNGVVDPQIEANLDIMRQVDQAWNDRDLETLGQFHAENGVFIFTIPEGVDRAGHLAEIEAFFTAFPDHMIELPHQLLFGQGDMIVALSRSSGTHLGPFTLPDGRVIPPTGKTITLELVTFARVENGQFVEEKLVFDNLSFLQQLGVVEINAEEPGAVDTEQPGADNAADPAAVNPEGPAL
jgi:predicted ester cyclase